MGWFSDMVDSAAGAGQAIGDFMESDTGLAQLAKLGIGSAVSGYFQPDVPVVGYQGKIPELQAVREQVPMQQPKGQPARRPGSTGRRYFSDTQFAERPDTSAPSVAQAKATAQAQAQQLAQQNQAQGMAAGGIASANKGYYLGGKTDGMADEVPATIDGTQEARLSDGEFVIPADVVSHLGNGNSDAGADQLHGMMDGVRKARTGNPKQGKQIDPNKFMPKMAHGGSIKKFNEGGTTTDTTSPVGQKVGTSDSLANWAGDYVTDMLGQGKALGNQAYQSYTGPLSAGESGLQQQAFTGIGALQAPTGMGAYTPETFGAQQAQDYMNPYLMASLNPQLEEARRQSEIDRIANAGRMTQAGSFGGSRQALMDMENQRNLQANLANITGQGYASAYDRAREQFNTEQSRGMQAQDAANRYGFDVLGRQEAAGATQRGIESEGMAADYAQFREERDYPYKQVQYMQSLLQGLPVEAQSISYTAPSQFQQSTEAAESLADLYKNLFGG